MIYVWGDRSGRGRHDLHMKKPRPWMMPGGAGAFLNSNFTNNYLPVWLQVRQSGGYCLAQWPCLWQHSRAASQTLFCIMGCGVGLTARPLYLCQLAFPFSPGCPG